MRQVVVKKLREYIRTNLTELLLKIRNEFGDKTEQMESRQIYQNAKKLYKRGKIKLT